jgi:hypothetical protein
MKPSKPGPSKRRRRPLPFWRRRRDRIAFHVTLLACLALGALVLPDDIRIWFLCGVPIAFLSAIKLLVLHETRRRTPAEKRELRQREKRERAGYQNPQHSTVMDAAR